MSADFINRFKGKAQTMDRNGPTTIVENSFKPIRAPAYREEHPIAQMPSPNTRMDLNSIQRNYLNFSNEIKHMADPRMQMPMGQQYMPMAPMFMPPIYDVNQLNFAPNSGHHMPQQFSHQYAHQYPQSAYTHQVD